MYSHSGPSSSASRHVLDQERHSAALRELLPFTADTMDDGEFLDARDDLLPLDANIPPTPPAPAPVVDRSQEVAELEQAVQEGRAREDALSLRVSELENALLHARQRHGTAASLAASRQFASVQEAEEQGKQTLLLCECGSEHMADLVGEGEEGREGRGAVEDYRLHSQELYDALYLHPNPSAPTLSGHLRDLSVSMVTALSAAKDMAQHRAEESAAALSAAESLHHRQSEEARAQWHRERMELELERDTLRVALEQSREEGERQRQEAERERQAREAAQEGEREAQHQAVQYGHLVQCLQIENLVVMRRLKDIFSTGAHIDDTPVTEVEIEGEGEVEMVTPSAQGLFPVKEEEGAPGTSSTHNMVPSTPTRPAPLNESATLDTPLAMAAVETCESTPLAAGRGRRFDSSPVRGGARGRQERERERSGRVTPRQRESARAGVAGRERDSVTPRSDRTRPSQDSRRMTPSRRERERERGTPVNRTPVNRTPTSRASPRPREGERERDRPLRMSARMGTNQSASTAARRAVSASPRSRSVSRRSATPSRDRDPRTERERQRQRELHRLVTALLQRLSEAGLSLPLVWREGPSSGWYLGDRRLELRAVSGEISCRVGGGGFVPFVGNVLTLSPEGLEFLSQSRYLLAFFDQFSQTLTQRAGRDIDFNAANSDCSPLFSSPLLGHLVIAVTGSTAQEPTAALFRRHVMSSPSTDASLSSDSEGDSMRSMVRWHYTAVQSLALSHPSLPQITLDTSDPSGAEIRHCVDAMPDSALGCFDINDDLCSESSIMDTGAYAVYLACFFGLMAVTLILVQLPARVAYLKGDDNTSALTNTLAVFNVVYV
ncbi:hypothetical protein KIPB_004496 [Kipferlia bialata]|uniref:Uncharacterized protein n=1 Tax=Kipferlia bialata TaxID=797122 RepID=A0A9K3CW29_9EUKA|nr:hypothetical protein KIPB_004496 [Kipferlia bialata]|eukprot:g4496.t1